MNQAPFDAAANPAADIDGSWQTLPARARLLFLLGNMLVPGLLAAVAGYFAIAASDLASPLWGALGGGLLGGAFGAWLGNKQYRYTFWQLDDEGLALRRGKFWQTETRVPATRVQHLDLKRGPLQRQRRLATLVVHTAGTKYSAVSVPHLDGDDAERLRDRLARQIDHDDDE